MHTNLFCSDKTKADSDSEQKTQTSTSEATSSSDTNHNQPAVASEAETAGAAEKGSAGKQQISERKLAANRRNSQRSTGPKTTAGKNNSRRNAIKHGILARKTLLLPGGQFCDAELSDYYDRLCAEYPGENLYAEFLRDDILFAYSGYGKAIELGKDLESQGRWSRINWGEQLDRYLSKNRNALLHDFKQLQKLKAERCEQEAESSEENEQQVGVTGSPESGEEDGSDFDLEEDEVDQDAEYEKAMLECEEECPYIPRRYYLDTTVAIIKGDWFAFDETSPTDEVERSVASNSLESPIGDDGKPSPSSAAEPASLAGTTHDLNEPTQLNVTGVDTLATSDVADALTPVKPQDDLGETAGAEAKTETAALPLDGLVDEADLASLVASYACVLEDGETQTSIADSSESVTVNTVPNSSADPEDQVSGTDTPAVAGGPEMSVQVEEPALPPSAEVSDDSQILPGSRGLQASSSGDLPAASMTVQ